jgi:hypothetical protein
MFYYSFNIDRFIRQGNVRKIRYRQTRNERGWVNSEQITFKLVEAVKLLITVQDN